MTKADAKAKASLAPVVAVVLAAACQAPPGDPGWLAGAWMYSEDSNIDVQCGVLAQPQVPLAGTPVQITETPTGADIELGCRCRLHLTPTGVLDGAGQSCTLVATAQNSPTGGQGSPVEITAAMDGWTLTKASGAGDGDAMTSVTTGTAEAVNLDGPVPVHCSFTMSGQLLRNPAPPPGCGDDSTAVGVIPAAGDLCPVGAGRDGLYFRMADDSATGCTTLPTDLGQPPYLPPDAVKPPSHCRPNRTKTPNTSLQFCRVDGRLFTPRAAPTVGATGAEYAVLKLGDDCPAGSQEVSKSINNQDTPPTDTTNSSLGRILPNDLDRLGAGTSTTLHFCLYTPPSTEDAQLASTTDAFPDLRFPYAVFHDFEGLQPSWVISKRWLISDNESDDPPGHNRYTGPDGHEDGAAVELMKRMVEDAGTDTTFDLARVR